MSYLLRIVYARASFYDLYPHFVDKPYVLLGHLVMDKTRMTTAMKFDLVQIDG